MVLKCWIDKILQIQEIVGTKRMKKEPNILHVRAISIVNQTRIGLDKKIFVQIRIVKNVTYQDEGCFFWNYSWICSKPPAWSKSLQLAS